MPLGLFVAGYPRERNSLGSGAAFAAGLGADGLPCVALFLLFVGAPRPFDPLLSTKAMKKG